MILKKPVPDLIRDGLPVFGKRSCPDKLRFLAVRAGAGDLHDGQFGAKPVARAAALRPCVTGMAGISPTEPQRSQIQKRHHRRGVMVMRTGEIGIAAFDAMDEAVLHQEIERAIHRDRAGRGIDLASSSITS